MRSHSSSVSRNRSAFTLVEIMVVIGIIGVLIAIALPAYSRVKLSAQKTATQATIAALSTGLENYRADSQLGGSYPRPMAAKKQCRIRTSPLRTGRRTSPNCPGPA